MRMAWRPVVCSALLGLAAVAGGCASYAPQRVTAGELKAPVTLQKGQELYVSLHANRSTGYSWQWVEKPDALVKQLGEPNYAPSADRPGAGGTETFHFRAIAAGKQALRFLYRRAWEKSEKPIDVQVVPILVE